MRSFFLHSFCKSSFLAAAAWIAIAIGEVAGASEVIDPAKAKAEAMNAQGLQTRQKQVRCSARREKHCGRNSVVECQLPKLDVVGSNPIARF
jgi:hypothetical protein